jgi:Phage integrase, N-terminal SAM-like domain
VVLGTKAELKTEKNAERSFKPFLDRANAVDYRPLKFGKFGDFSEIWEKEVLVHQKPSSRKAIESHLRTYIRPWLGKIRMEEFIPQAQQSFITRLSQQVSRKTVLNVLSTLGSMLRTAKQWNYNCPTLNLRELALPAKGNQKAGAGLLQG